LTFTDIPRFFKLAGSVFDKKSQLMGKVGYNTDLLLAFKTLLQKAKTKNLSQDDMPDTILVFSDMQFDSNGGFGMNQNAMDSVLAMYEEAGYTAPLLVWWNLNSHIGTLPVKSHITNSALVSGFSPSQMKAVLKGKLTITPEETYFDLMNDVRYEKIYV
jgi:hypothetical protein